MDIDENGDSNQAKCCCFDDRDDDCRPRNVAEWLFCCPLYSLYYFFSGLTCLFATDLD